MKIFIGCSSSEYISNKYLDDCRIILDKLFSLDNDMNTLFKYVKNKKKSLF